MLKYFMNNTRLYRRKKTWNYINKQIFSIKQFNLGAFGLGSPIKILEQPHRAHKLSAFQGSGFIKVNYRKYYAGKKRFALTKKEFLNIRYDYHER